MNGRTLKEIEIDAAEIQVRINLLMDKKYKDMNKYMILSIISIFVLLVFIVLIYA